MSIYKVCGCCGQSKPISEFYGNGKVDGKQKYKPKCRDCYLDFAKSRRQHIQKLIKETFGTYSCKVCGYDKCSRALHLHHLDPKEKEMSLSDMWSKSDEKILDEIHKCVILCANCHAEVHDGMIEVSQ
jgi:hypothetical protein